MSSQNDKAFSSFGGDGFVAHYRPSTAAPKPIGRIIDLILLWQARAAERAHLASLPDYLVRDMGLSRKDVEAYAAVPFWKV